MQQQKVYHEIHIFPSLVHASKKSCWISADCKHLCVATGYLYLSKAFSELMLKWWPYFKWNFFIRHFFCCVNIPTDVNKNSQKWIKIKSALNLLSYLCRTRVVLFIDIVDVAVFFSSTVLIFLLCVDNLCRHACVCVHEIASVIMGFRIMRGRL